MLNNIYDLQLQQNLLSNSYPSCDLYLQDPSPPEQLNWLDSPASSNESGYPKDLTGDDLLQIIQESNASPTLNNTPVIPDNPIIPIFEASDTPPANFPIKIEYKIFPDVIPKHQKRIKGKSEQRVKNGNISFILDFQDMVTFQLIYDIQVYVKRTKELVGTPQFIGAVNLKPKFEAMNGFKYLVEVDLDSVYEVNGKKVYELQKTLMEELNKYHLIVAVSLQDGRTTNLRTKEFLLLGKETAPKPPDEKRTRKDSNSSDEVIFNFFGGSSPSSGYGSGRDQEEEVIRARHIVADYVQTKSIEIGGVLHAKKIESPNGDIAYHFTLEDSNDLFEEGEVVGLHANKKENKQKLVKLTARNAGDFTLKGVITRSQYFEAMKPAPGVKSETVCMMGIVPVKVQGTVYPNDPLYASPKVPGVAVSGTNLNDEEIKCACLIGYSFQSRFPHDEDRVGMVEAGVSVLSTASQTLLNQRLKSIEHHWEKQMVKLMKKNEMFRKRFQAVIFASVVIVTLLGILLWQLLLPGSAFRYYKCKIGSLPGKTSYFYLMKGKPIFDNFDINGIEFEFNKLTKKIDSNSYEKMDMPGVRYYLNIDGCAFGGERTTRDHFSGGKRVSGPMVYAVNGDCNKVYSYYQFEGKWKEIGGKQLKVTKLGCIF